MHPAFPPDPARLEIDRVEWVPASAQVLRVHVLGRWSDRSVPDVLLLVGDGERRHGFEALPTAPAGVLLAFELPNELRGALTRDIALQVGSTEMSVPPAVPGPLGDSPGQLQEGEVIDRAVLAERRARRAEQSEDATTRRAEAAEQSTQTLEAQLENLEERLRLLRAERAELEAGAADAERRLRAAEERERAERQRRTEAQDELRAARDQHASELAALREELEAAAVRPGVPPSGARTTLDDLRSNVARLEALVEQERAERERAEQTVAENREAARGELKRLEHELTARRAAHDEMVGELVAARAELDRLRGGAPRPALGGPAAPSPAALASAAELARTIAELERRTADAERDAATLRAALDARSAELEQARRDLDLAAQRDDAGRRRDDLMLAWQGVEAVRSTATELRAQLDAQRAEQAALERELDLERRRADVAQAEADRATAELSTERERAGRLEQRLAEVQGTLGEQAARMLAIERDHADRERKLQELVTEVLRTSASLRTRFEAEIRELERQLTERLVTEREEAAAKIAAMEAQVAALERQARATDAVRAENARRADLKAQAESLRAELDRVRGVAAEHRSREGSAADMIGGLDAAASRLRAERPPLDDGADEAPAPPPAEPATVEPEPAGAVAPEPQGEQPDEPRIPLAAPSRPDAPATSAWLAPAIATVAEEDADAAAGLLVAALTAQPLGGRDITYDIDLEQAGAFRARRRAGVTTVERLADPSAAGADFRLTGPPASIAELVAGGARKRPDDLRVSGRRRRLRRLLKGERRPLQLSDLRQPSVDIDPGLLLTLVAAAVDPGWTVGHDFAVSWKVGGASSGTWTMAVASGLRPRVLEGLPEEPPTAVVYVSGSELVPLLAGLELSTFDAASVVGDVDVVELLRGWFGRAQHRD